MPDLSISVVSLTWNSERFVDPMLGSLFADAKQSGLEIEVIMVDNGSSDGTLAKIEAFQASHPNLHLVKLKANHGTTVSRNIGIRMAKGQYVLILDSDTEIPQGTLAGLVGSVQELPDPQTAGIICPLLVYPNGEFQESARRFPTVQTKVLRLLGLEVLRSRDESVESVMQRQVTPVDYAISAAWFIPRATFERIGRLDEKIFYAPEDVEFCARAWRHGLKVWYYPKVRIVHNCQRLTNKKPLTKLGLSHAKGLVRYWWRYGAFFTRPNVRAVPPANTNAERDAAE